MRTQSQQMRDILDAVRYPVDPRHESDFSIMLLNDKERRRRNLFWFCLCSLGILVAGYVWISSQQQRVHETPVQQTSDREATTLLSSPPPVNESASSDTKDLLNSATSIQTGTTSTSESAVAMQAVQSNSPTRDIQSSGSKGKQTSFTESVMNNEQAASKEQTETIPSQNNVILAQRLVTRSDERNTKSSAIPSDENTGTIVWIDNKGTKSDVAGVNRNDQTLNETLTTPLAMLTYEQREIVKDAHIIPALRKTDVHRIHYGVSGAWFPAGSLLTSNTLKTGYGFQVGGYASYRMKPRLQLRADVGFGRLDGGFSYIKESASEQYGFSVLHQSNTLAVQQLYTGYASTEIGLKRGNNRYCIGLLGQFLYGARGNIVKVERALNEQQPTVTTSENVWVTTGDMQRISLQGSVGLRSHVTRRLELAAMVRIPITQTVKRPHTTGAYAYEVSSHGISPQIMFSYQINQQ